MPNARAKAALPHRSDALFLTDSGLETGLIYRDGIELPGFAAFTLLATPEGRAILTRYYRRHAALAERHGAGFVWESVGWRASSDWGDKLGYSPKALAQANRDGIALMRDAAADFAGPAVFSGNLGPRGDGYMADQVMSVAEAADYHARQVAAYAETGVDMVSAFTMTHAAEAAGIARAAALHDLPSVISFTVETDGRLPSGDTLADAIAAVDEASGGAPTYYMINCAHPTHFAAVLDGEAPWTRRVGGVRANASKLSHAALEAATELDDGDPAEFGADYAALRRRLPSLKVLGGCCGTDLRHVAAAAEACLGRARAAA